MAVILEEYQNRVVDALVDVFHKAVSGSPDAVKSAVLKAPTASGKTVMLSRGLSVISSGGVPTAWFWFAPYDNIIGQTERTIASEAGESLRPKHLRDRTWGGHRAGDVWVSTAALASSSKAGPAEDSEFSPSLRSMSDEIRKAGLKIGVVIDEAHLNAKQKGRFVEAIGLISPDVVFAASATPKDEALDKFFASLGIDHTATITVDRDEVVDRHLNKRGIWARLISAETAGPDAKLDLLVRATWARQIEIENALAEIGLNITPLALFQADNKAEGERMLEAVKRVTGLSDKEVAFYDSESKSKSQRNLNEIADDPTVRALVFKVAAGTGFDAPRAFCLGSARTVRDETSAAQFVGRTMRVPRALRAFLFSNPDHPLCDVLNNSHLFLIDEDSQTGFSAAVQQIAGSFAAAGVNEVSVKRIDEEGREVDDTPSEVPLHRAEILRRAGPDGEGYPDIDALTDALGEDSLTVWFPRHEAFSEPLPREEWRQDDAYSADDVLDKLDGSVITPHRVKDRLDRAAGQFFVVEAGDDLNTEEDEEDVKVRKWQAVRAARSDAVRSFEQSVSLIPGFSEPGLARELLGRMTEEVIATRIVPREHEDLAARIAMLIAVDFHAEMKHAATKGDGAGRVIRQAAALPDAYLTHGKFSSNTRMGYGYFVADTDYVQPDESLSSFIKDLCEKGIKVAGQLLRIAFSDQTLTLNGIERDFIRWVRGRDEIASTLRNPQGKPYSTCYANVAGQNRLFYPDFVVALKNGKKVSVETKYDRKDLREKMAGRDNANGLPVIFVVKNEVTGGLEMITGHDETGREIARPLSFEDFA